MTESPSNLEFFIALVDCARSFVYTLTDPTTMQEQLPAISEAFSYYNEFKSGNLSKDQVDWHRMASLLRDASTEAERKSRESRILQDS